MVAGYTPFLLKRPSALGAAAVWPRDYFLAGNVEISGLAAKIRRRAPQPSANGILNSRGSRCWIKQPRASSMMQAARKFFPRHPFCPIERPRVTGRRGLATGGWRNSRELPPGASRWINVVKGVGSKVCVNVQAAVLVEASKGEFFVFHDVC